MWLWYNTKIKLKIHIFNKRKILQRSERAVVKYKYIKMGRSVLPNLPTFTISQTLSHKSRWVSSQFHNWKTHSLSESCDSLTVTILRYTPPHSLLHHVLWPLFLNYSKNHLPPKMNPPAKQGNTSSNRILTWTSGKI